MKMRPRRWPSRLSHPYDRDRSHYDKRINAPNRNGKIDVANDVLRPWSGLLAIEALHDLTPLTANGLVVKLRAERLFPTGARRLKAAEEDARPRYLRPAPTGCRRKYRIR